MFSIEHASDALKKILELAMKEALDFKHQELGPEHLLLGLMKEGKNVGALALKAANIDPLKVRFEIKKLTFRKKEMSKNVDLSETAGSILDKAQLFSCILNHVNHPCTSVCGDALLLGLFKVENRASEILLKSGISIFQINEIVEAIRAGSTIVIRCRKSELEQHSDSIFVFGLLNQLGINNSDALLIMKSCIESPEKASKLIAMLHSFQTESVLLEEQFDEEQKFAVLCKDAMAARGLSQKDFGGMLGHGKNQLIAQSISDFFELRS